MSKKYKLELIVLLFVLISAGYYLIYKQTKDSYMNVGFNNGSIHTGSVIVERIKNIAGPLKSCKEFKGMNVNVVVNVKSESLCLVQQLNSSGYHFCIDQ
jgi:hypothetical protein